MSDTFDKYNFDSGRGFVNAVADATPGYKGEIRVALWHRRPAFLYAIDTRFGEVSFTQGNPGHTFPLEIAFPEREESQQLSAIHKETIRTLNFAMVDNPQQLTDVLKRWWDSDASLESTAMTRYVRKWVDTFLDEHGNCISALNLRNLGKSEENPVITVTLTTGVWFSIEFRTTKISDEVALTRDWKKDASVQKLPTTEVLDQRLKEIIRDEGLPSA